MNVSTLVIHPSQKRLKTSQSRGEKPFRKKFMIESINRAVREQRYVDYFSSLPKSTKNVLLPLSNKSYDDIFKKLIEGCQRFFTSEYGKNEDDYRRFLDGCTKEYTTTKENENICLDRINYFKAEVESEKLKNLSSVQSERKVKHFGFHRFKSKISKDASKLRLKTIFKKSRMTTRKTKRFTKKVDLSEELERSASELSEPLSEVTVFKFTSRNYKPFVYKLSDPEMKANGITVNYELPMRIITFSAIPSSPLTFWFQKRSEILRTHYPDGSLCGQFEKLGNGALYYKNGDRAISFVFGRTGPLIIVYSQSKWVRQKVIRSVPVALFDLKGNGVVYNSSGQKRLIYDQAEGILIDSPSKFPIRWKWNSYYKVMCRRKELQFAPSTKLTDFDYEEKTELLKKYNKLRRIKTKKNTSISSILSAKSKKHLGSLNKNSFIKSSKRKRLSLTNKITPFKKITKSHDFSVLPKLEISKPEEEPPGKEKVEYKESYTCNPAIPKILKFVGKGFVIKPLVTPCHEVLHLSVFSNSETPFVLENHSKPKVTQASRASRRIVQQQKSSNTLPELLVVPPTRCKHELGPKSLLKPIVMKLTETVSLTIMNQQHIHIDFISYPMHYMFCIGVSILTDSCDSIYDVRDSEAPNEPIPSVFETLKKKCPMLYQINNSIKNLQAKAENKLITERKKKLKNWGQYKHFGKVPICELMDNKCWCVKRKLVCSCIP